MKKRQLPHISSPLSIISTLIIMLTHYATSADAENGDKACRAQCDARSKTLFAASNYTSHVRSQLINPTREIVETYKLVIPSLSFFGDYARDRSLLGLGQQSTDFLKAELSRAKDLQRSAELSLQACLRACVAQAVKRGDKVEELSDYLKPATPNDKRMTSARENEWISHRNIGDNTPLAIGGNVKGITNFAQLSDEKPGFEDCYTADTAIIASQVVGASQEQVENTLAALRSGQPPSGTTAKRILTHLQTGQSPRKNYFCSGLTNGHDLSASTVCTLWAKLMNVPASPKVKTWPTGARGCAFPKGGPVLPIAPVVCANYGQTKLGFDPANVSNFSAWDAHSFNMTCFYLPKDAIGPMLLKVRDPQNEVPQEWWPAELWGSDADHEEPSEMETVDVKYEPFDAKDHKGKEFYLKSYQDAFFDLREFAPGLSFKLTITDSSPHKTRDSNYVTYKNIRRDLRKGIKQAQEAEDALKSGLQGVYNSAKNETDPRKKLLARYRYLQYGRTLKKIRTFKTASKAQLEVVNELDDHLDGIKAHDSRMRYRRNLNDLLGERD